MDHGLRARQALRFIQSDHVSKTDESYKTIHNIDPGFYRLRALANSTSEAPDEQKWDIGWETQKGRFQGWTKVHLKKWFGNDMSPALQSQAKMLKKQDEDATALSTNVMPGQKATDDETTKALMPEDNPDGETITINDKATDVHSETGESDVVQPSYISPPLLGGPSKPEDHSPPPRPSAKDHGLLDSEPNDLKKPKHLVPQSIRASPSPTPVGFAPDVSTCFSPGKASTNPASIIRKAQTPEPSLTRPPSQLGVKAPARSSMGVLGDASGQDTKRNLFGASIAPFGDITTGIQPQGLFSTPMASSGIQSWTPMVTKSPNERTPSSAAPKTPAQAPTHPLTLTTEPTTFATGRGKLTTSSPAGEKAPEQPSITAFSTFDPNWMGAKLFNAIPSAANFFSGSPSTPKTTPGHAKVPTGGESSAQGQARCEYVSQLEEGQSSKLTLANLSLHEASPEGASRPKSNKPHKEWYEWYKNRHMDRKDHH
ncbi:hypothetical protein CDV36_014914 [Fusarium kuroshium]|uniref:Uncharacterized protein n=1 Tax=Fusarium kuroshium TaxID=2010991 RepID=A0A3M2RE29_9HYPO|nr:hypothetical protein CDV36_014914 [Fusarium kuroshium]